MEELASDLTMLHPHSPVSLGSAGKARAALAGVPESPCSKVTEVH